MVRIGSVFGVIVGLGMAALSAVSQSPQKRIVGYFPSWGIYARNYHVPNIPAAQLTHINYAFANIQNGSIALGDAYADIDRFYPGDCWNPGCLRGSFHQLQILKAQHPQLRTLISVGGWTWSGGFSDAVLTQASRAQFAQSIVDFVDLYDFDGADIDWEYPVAGGLPGNTVRPQDRANFAAFLVDLRQRFTARAQTTNKTYLVTIAAPANPAYLPNYDWQTIVPVLDWINLMAYDLRGPWGDPFTGFHAPLYADPLEPVAEPVRSQWNADATITNYLAAGVPAAKLQLGMAFYGRGFGQVQPTTNGLYATYNGPSQPGTWENGVYDYTDLQQHYENAPGWQKTWHATARTPWLWNAAQRVFIGYDDPRSIAEKCWRLQQRGLGGAMFWELSGDRNATLLSTMQTWLRQRPALVASSTTVSLASPQRVDLALHGDTARAGSIYMVLGSLSGTDPGTAMPGGLLPLNVDFLTSATLSQARSALFPGTMGVLDAAGNAQAAFDFAVVPSLPASLLGMSVHAASWVCVGSSLAAGEASNPIELRFVP